MKAIYEYTDYRLYVKDYINLKKEKLPSYSLEVLSRESGQISKSYLSLILNGKRNISESKLIVLGKTLGLSSKHLNYFTLLAKLNQAKSHEERKYYFSLLCKKRPSSLNKRIIKKDKYQILESWQHIAILELTRLKEFKLNPKWIQSKLKFNLSLSQIDQSLSLLKDLNLIIISNNDAKPSDALFSSDDEVPSSHVQHYHASMLELAQNAVIEEELHNKEFQSITFPTDPKKFQELKSIIKEFTQNIVKHNGEKTELAQVNIQLFKLTSDHKGEITYEN